MPSKDYMTQYKLNDLIIREYRKGRTVESIQKEVANLTIDESGGLCLKGMLRM